MNTVRILGRTALTSVVLFGAAIATLDMAEAQAQSCTKVLGPKRARVLTKDCAPSLNGPSGRNVQPSPIVQNQDRPDADQLTPGQSVTDTDAIGGSDLEEQTQPKFRFRGPKRGGYLEN